MRVTEYTFFRSKNSLHKPYRNRMSPEIEIGDSQIVPDTQSVRILLTNNPLQNSKNIFQFNPRSSEITTILQHAGQVLSNS